MRLSRGSRFLNRLNNFNTLIFRIKEQGESSFLQLFIGYPAIFAGKLFLFVLATFHPVSSPSIFSISLELEQNTQWRFSLSLVLRFTPPKPWRQQNVVDVFSRNSGNSCFHFFLFLLLLLLLLSLSLSPIVFLDELHPRPGSVPRLNK